MACEVSSEDSVVCKISGEANEEIIRILRRILAPHQIVDNKIVICGQDAAALAFCLGYGNNKTIDVNQTVKCHWISLAFFAV